MKNLVGLTKLVFDGKKTNNTHAIESLLWHCMSVTSRQSVENENCNKTFKKILIRANKVENVQTVTH